MFRTPRTRQPWRPEWCRLESRSESCSFVETPQAPGAKGSLTYIESERLSIIIQFELLFEHRNVQYGLCVPAQGPGANTCQFGGPRLFFLA
jgi:hypothetical protein